MLKKFLRVTGLLVSCCIILSSVSSFFTLAENVNILEAEQKDIQIIREDPTALDWDSAEVAYIDFSEVGTVSVTADTEGKGLNLMANYGVASWKAANRVSEDGYLLLGKEANTNGADPESFDVGNAYFKLALPKSEKAKTAYALKIDYYGGGEKVDSGSYINITYNSIKGNASGRNTYGATYNSEKVETMYYTFPEADFSENVGTCGADFRLETWNQAQLKIRRVSVLEYVPLDVPEMKTLVKAPEGPTEPVSSIDFSKIESIPLSGTVSGDGLTLVTNISTGNTRASNKLENGYLLLGRKARTNDNIADMQTKPEVNGAIYIKLDTPLEEKAATSYAVKIDYYGGGISADAGSYIDLCHKSLSSANKKVRKTYGSTWNSGKDESMYYLLNDADFCEKVNNESCGADFRLETWCGNGTTTGAQLKIKKISVVKYDSSKAPEDPATLFVDVEGDDIPEDTVFINPNAGERYGINYATGTPVVKIIDKNGVEHFVAQSVDYLNFKISDAEVKAADKVTITISYWDIGKRGFSIEYNSAIPETLPPNTPENFYNYYSTSTFEMYDTKELVTLEIPLESVAFNGKQSGGNDFRLRTMYIPDFYVESISVKIGIEDVTLRPPVEFPETTEINNFKDKTVAGYQAWFQASDSKTSGWNHWNSGAAPEGSQQTFDIYPDVSDYPDSVLFQTGYSNLLNGQPAVLYDGTTEEAIDVQVKWMKDYGIDGFAVSRFYAGTSAVEIKVRNKLDYMKEAAEKYDRLFYMGYDMSGIGGAGLAGIKRLQSDFVLNVEKKYVTSPNYAQIDGKPVVSLWGFQGSEFNRYPNTENALILIDWFHDRGYYVIGGCPDNNWAKDTSDYAEVYRRIDMITPWTVGRYGNGNAEEYLDDKYKQDREYIDAFNAENPDTPKSYMPTIFPGFSWANWATGPHNGIPRLAGEFMWTQARLARKYGFTSSFIAMFDEYDEGTSVAKMAEDSMSIPSDQYFVTGAADGKWLSSDFYLRATAAVAKLLRKEIPDSKTIPIPHATGPIYWRNGFERRFINYKTTSGQFVTALANIDVCVPNGEILSYIGIEDMNFFDIAEDPYASGYTTTGEYSLNINGIAKPSGNESMFYFKLADTDITVHDNMVLQYNLRPENELGGHVFIDLIFSDGSLLSEINGSATKAERGTIGKWSEVTFNIPSSMSGKKITSVVAAYDYAYAGEFNAYIDDVIIQDGTYGVEELESIIKDAKSLISGVRSSYFTAASVKSLKNAISSAKSALGGSATAVKFAFDNLMKAVNKLVAVARELPKDSTETTPPPEKPSYSVEVTPLPNPETPSDSTENIDDDSETTTDEDNSNIENTEEEEKKETTKKVIKKVKKSNNGNKVPLEMILVLVAVLAVGLIAIMAMAAYKNKKTQ